MEKNKFLVEVGGNDVVYKSLLLQSDYQSDYTSND